MQGDLNPEVEIKTILTEAWVKACDSQGYDYGTTCTRKTLSESIYDDLSFERDWKMFHLKNFRNKSIVMEIARRRMLAKSSKKSRNYSKKKTLNLSESWKSQEKLLLSSETGNFFRKWQKIFVKSRYSSEKLLNLG